MHSWLKTVRQSLARELPEDRIAEEQCYGSSKAGLKNFYPYFRRHWRGGLTGCLFALAASLLVLVPPLIIRFLVDDVIVGKQVGLLAGAVVMLTFCLAAEKLAGLLEAFYFARFEQQVTLDIQEDLIDRVLHFPKSFFDNKQSGYLQSRLTEDVDGIRWFFSSTIVHIASNGLRLVGGAAFLFYLEWRLTAAVLTLIPAIALIFRFFSARIHRLSHQAMEHQADVSGGTAETISGISLVKASGNEGAARGRLMNPIRNMFQINLERRILNSLAGISINAMPALARVVTLALGASWIISGQWTLGSLIAYQAYLIYVFGPARMLASANLEFQKARAALERVSALFNVVPENIRETGCRVVDLKGGVEFRNVSFSYNGHDQILTGVSFRISPGERVVIAGPSGIGKTTLLSLILQFYHTTGGEIFFDGRPVAAYHTRSLRQRIGYVSQNPMIVTGSVLDNIRFGAPGASRDQIIQAAKTAAIHAEIDQLPQQYHTLIGAGGLNLSMGQKQRLALARAAVREPDLLLLDEPTSALDSETENLIFNALASQTVGKTVIVASHRPAAIEQADRVLLLNQYGLTDSGAPGSPPNFRALCAPAVRKTADRFATGRRKIAG